MNIKDSIGLRIKTERERQQMSRESLPSLDRLSYIAKRLGKNMADLLDHDRIEIPDTYYEMKNRLIKYPSYGDKERVKQKLELIEEVYEKFFDILPEEELFEQVKKKKKISTNDLLIIDYYFYHLYGRKQYDKKLFDRIVDRVLKQEIPTDDAYNIALFNDLMAIAALKIFHKSFSDFLVVVDKALAVIEKSQFHSYKPGVYILEAKYELLHKQNKKKAAENYDKAIMFASVLEDLVLEQKIREEKAADGL